MTDTNIKEQTDDQLIEQYKRRANDVSYFNAAEGDSWYAEKVPRELSQAEFRKIRDELVSRGLDLPKGNWLL